MAQPKDGQGVSERGLKQRVLAAPQSSAIFTIVMDVAMILAAILARSVLLYTLKRFAPPEAHNWAIEVLEGVMDIGLVCVAVTYTVFDLLKLLVRSFKELKREYEN